MNWGITYRADLQAARIADEHYSRQSHGTRQFTPPGRVLVLVTADYSALWCTSWPKAEYVHRIYPEAWLCSLFRNTSAILSSQLIREALAVTRWKYGNPPASGMVTMVDASKIKSRNPGYCFKVVGFKHVGYTSEGLHMLQLLPEDMPAPAAPNGVLPFESEVA